MYSVESHRKMFSRFRKPCEIRSRTPVTWLWSLNNYTVLRARLESKITAAENYNSETR